MGVDLASELPRDHHGLDLLQEVQRITHEQVHHAPLPSGRHPHPCWLDLGLIAASLLPLTSLFPNVFNSQEYENRPRLPNFGLVKFYKSVRC